jgi:parallel beta-helix repeat protein
MKKLVSIMGVTVLLVGLLVHSVAIADGPTTWTVDDDKTECPTADFTHPQDAVNAANPGDTILVYPGTYGSRVYTAKPPHWSNNDKYAPSLIVYKDGLTIKAMDPDPANTIIETTHDYWSNKVAIQASTGGTWDGSQYVGAGVYPNDGTAPNAVAVIASGVTIDGFTLRKPYMGIAWGGFWNTAGVMIGGLYAGDSQFLGSDGNTVQNCVFEDVWHAVYIWHSSDNMIVNNTVNTLVDTGHWAAISIYDGYNDAQIGLGHLSENNLIAHNTLANKGIALGAWQPNTWTSNAGSMVCCNTVTQVGVTYSHGPVMIGCNTGGIWLSNTDKVIRIKGITYSGDTVSPGPVNLSAQLEYDGSADGSGVEVIFSIDGADYSATTTAGGVASTTVSMAPGLYNVGTKVAVCECCVFTDEALLAVYDPEGGFVTGGGWIDSPAGAYVPGPMDISGDTATMEYGGYTGYMARYLTKVCDPNNSAVTFAGTVDVSGLQDNGAVFIGLVDREWVDEGNTGWMGGAYAYFGRRTDDLIVGPTDGNLGGEIVQTFVTLTDYFDPAVYPEGPPLVTFETTIHAGSIEVSVSGSTCTDEYGVVKDLNSCTAYSWDEFQYGAYFGVDSWPSTNSVLFDVTVNGCQCELAGKASFGFVAKYKKGASVPEGNTEFVFRAGDLNFHSTDYDWLVVTGSDYARFKGTGTINGAGEYKFMLWAGDGTGTDGADTFRIKIWEEDESGNETVIYDNGMDQAIGGGSIVVHTSKK